MPAANTDLLKKLSRRWVGQIGAGGVADGTTATIPLSSTTNLPTDTAVVVVIDRVDANGTATASLEETVIGVVSGSNLVSCVRGAEGTAQAHVAGSVVEVLVTAKGWNDVVDHLLVSHNQAGYLLGSAVVASNVAASAVVEGALSLSDITTADVTTSRHGFTPKAPNDTTKFLRGDATWAVPSAGGIGADGWTSTSDSWTYASANTVTVPSGAASLYQKGDRVKFTQTTVKYFVITAVADTVLTFAVSTDYVVANAAISAISYSHQANPIGFPSSFAYTPTFGGFSAGPTATGKFSVVGNLCYFTINQSAAGTSNATTFTMTAPITSGLGVNLPLTPGQAIDNGSAITTPPLLLLASSSTTINCYKDFTGATWTGSGNKQIQQAFGAYFI